MRPGDKVAAPKPQVARAPRGWSVRPAGDVGPLTEALGVDPIVAQLLLNRKVDDASTARMWLSGSLRDLPDPRLMTGMPAAVDRLLAAIDSGELICVHGDYDVDGCTSVALLVHLLRRLGAQVTWYAPHRHRDGYGIALHTVRRLAQEGVAVMITCDTGVTAHAAVDLGNELGIDTVVCDHHTVPDELPAAAAIVNPKLDGEGNPYVELAAVGVSFMLAVALRARFRDRGAFSEAPEPDLREYLDIVALGTVADLAPLRGINRLLVQTGLKVLAARRRPGLRALMEVSGIKADEPVISQHLGFRLGPRINAAGRLAEAARSVDLLLCDDDAEADRIARELDEYNRRRQDTERQIFAEALEQLQADDRLAERRGIVLWSRQWHSGVVGIVASRLVQYVHKPAVVIAVGEDGVGTGSGRGIRGVDLYSSLQRSSDLLERFGGHRMAAGLTIREENLPALADAFLHEAFADSDPKLWEPVLSVDAELDLQRATWALQDALEAMGPFGIGNPEPVFVARGLRATGVRALNKGGIRMDLQGPGGQRIKAVGFGLGIEPADVEGLVDVAFSLQTNFWRGRSTLELRLRDLRLAE